jgi:hypothetical protein
MRFYLGSICTSGRADLMPVYAMIFRQLHAMRADWIYHVPEIHIVDSRHTGPRMNRQPATPPHGPLRRN